QTADLPRPPDATTTLRRHARDLAYAGKHRKAAEVYQQALEGRSADASCTLRLAEAHRRSGDVGAARRAYRRAIALFLECGFDAKAMAVQRALDGLRQPAPRPARARMIAEHILLIIACAMVSAAAKVAAAVADARATAAARRSATRSV